MKKLLCRERQQVTKLNNMNEPKEKAEEIISKLQGIIYEHGAGHESTVSYNDIKKIGVYQCDEIINAGANDVLMSDDSVISGRDYWNEVKKAISEL